MLLYSLYHPVSSSHVSGGVGTFPPTIRAPYTVRHPAKICITTPPTVTSIVPPDVTIVPSTPPILTPNPAGYSKEETRIIPPPLNLFS